MIALNKRVFNLFFLCPVLAIVSGCAQYNYSPEGSANYKLGEKSINLDSPSLVFFTAFPGAKEIKQEKFETKDEYNKRLSPYKALSERSFVYLIPPTEVTIDAYPDKNFYFLRTRSAQPRNSIVLADATNPGKESYIGQNAYGATVRVHEYQKTEWAVSVSNTSSLPSFALKREVSGNYYIGLPIKEPDINILSALKNGTVTLAIKIRVNSKEKASIDTRYSNPTIKSPIDYLRTTYSVPIIIEEMFLIDTKRKISVLSVKVE